MNPSLGSVAPAEWPDPFAPDEFADRVCLVTGAANGIGAAIAARLAELGAAVAVSDLDVAAANAYANGLKDRGYKAGGFALDVRSTDAIDSAVDSIERSLGPVDVLVNNAGLCLIGESTDVPDSEWQLHVDVLLTGPFKVARRVGREMLNRRSGAVVNICSIGGFGGHPQRAAYNAAKGGVKVLTEVLASEWAPVGVRVNGVAPAVTRTGILADVVSEAKGAIKVDEFAGRTPMGRIAEPEEIADAVVFLASDRASFVTGETLAVDGGWLSSDGFPHGASRP